MTAPRHHEQADDKDDAGKVDRQIVDRVPDRDEPCDRQRRHDDELCDPSKTINLAITASCCHHDIRCRDRSRCPSPVGSTGSHPYRIAPDRIDPTQPQRVIQIAAFVVADLVETLDRPLVLAQDQQPSSIRPAWSATQSHGSGALPDVRYSHRPLTRRAHVSSPSGE